MADHQRSGEDFSAIANLPVYLDCFSPREYTTLAIALPLPCYIYGSYYDTRFINNTEAIKYYLSALDKFVVASESNQDPPFVRLTLGELAVIVSVMQAKRLEKLRGCHGNIFNRLADKLSDGFYKPVTRVLLALGEKLPPKQRKQLPESFEEFFDEYRYQTLGIKNGRFKNR